MEIVFPAIFFFIIVCLFFSATIFLLLSFYYLRPVFIASFVLAFNLFNPLSYIHINFNTNKFLDFCFHCEIYKCWKIKKKKQTEQTSSSKSRSREMYICLCEWVFVCMCDYWRQELHQSHQNCWQVGCIGLMGATQYKIKCQTISRLQLTVSCIQFIQEILYHHHHYKHFYNHRHICRWYHYSHHHYHCRLTSLVHILFFLLLSLFLALFYEISHKFYTRLFFNFFLIFNRYKL